MINSHMEKQFVTFSTELFQHQSTSDTFFDSNLLWYIKKNFGFSDSLINIYDENAGYHMSILPDQQGTDYSFRTYLKNQYSLDYHRDPCSSFINTFCRKTNWQNAMDHRLFLSTDIIPSIGYEDSEYIRCLRNFGFNHSLAMPFGESGCFHLTFYKRIGEGTFSDRELNVISNIYQLLLHAYHAYESMQSQKAMLQHCGPAADETGKAGIILLDKFFNVLSYDDTAKKNVSDMHHTLITRLENTHISFLNLLFPRNKPHEKIQHKAFQEYDFTLFPFTMENPLHLVKQYYCLKITKKNRIEGQMIIPHASFDCLTKRELEIVRLLAEGLSYEQIANQLFISISTVRNHIQNIYKKLTIHNQRQLLRIYSENK